MKTAEKNHLALRSLIKIDAILKIKGADAALKALTTLRMEIPLNATIRRWLDSYREMLLAWHAGLIPDVVKEFKTYGFRRAQNVAHQCGGAAENKRLSQCYIACVQSLADMAERSRWAATERESTEAAEPQEVSIDDVSEEHIQRGIKL